MPCQVCRHRPQCCHRQSPNSGSSCSSRVATVTEVAAAKACSSSFSSSSSHPRWLPGRATPALPRPDHPDHGGTIGCLHSASIDRNARCPQPSSPFVRHPSVTAIREASRPIRVIPCVILRCLSMPRSLRGTWSHDELGTAGKPRPGYRASRRTIRSLRSSIAPPPDRSVGAAVLVHMGKNT